MLATTTTGWDTLADWATPDALNTGLRDAAAETAALWQRAATGLRLPRMTRGVHWAAWAASVHIGQPVAGQITISADAGMTEQAVTARPSWDMKPGLLNGPHAKTGKHGTRYNRIPFGHPHPSPEAQHALAQGLSYQTWIGMRSKITPGGRYTWRTGTESGIRRGRNGHAVTYRTVSSRSPAGSWWYPALPANPVLESVWDAVAEDAADAVVAALVAAP